MEHIGIFSASGDVQTALDNGTLKNGYIALVGGELDYNTMRPTGPEPELAWVWSDIEDGKSLVFNDISDTCPVFVDSETYPDGRIALINNNVVDGEHQDGLCLAFFYDDFYRYVTLHIPGDSGPERIWEQFFDFEDGQAWSEQVTGMALTGETASETDSLVVSFDGQRTFTLTTADHEDGIVLDMTTVPGPLCDGNCE